MSFSKCVSAGNQRNGLLVIHCHAGKRLANVLGCGERIRLAAGPFRVHEVTLGQALSNAHFMDGMNRAKKRAAVRQLRGIGVPAVTYDDVLDCLLDVACEAARQMEADPQMLIRQLDVKVPVARIDVVPRHELEEHRYVRLHSA